MPISDDLMQSILSMDSYNRGYGAGIILNSNNIGKAQLGIDSSELGQILQNGIQVDKHETIGFYALSYDTNNDGNAVFSFEAF
ncbi:MAG: hypothetical protein HRT94_07265 [Alphaproteobacteria bacterium]|nr:hypothetical protein [Alphaproteobacteria bacterium]